MKRPWRFGVHPLTAVALWDYTALAVLAPLRCDRNVSGSVATDSQSGYAALPSVWTEDAGSPVPLDASPGRRVPALAQLDRSACVRSGRTHGLSSAKRLARREMGMNASTTS